MDILAHAVHNEMHTLVFDFDGTLIDSYAAVLRIYNKLACDMGLATITQHDADLLKQYSAQELFKHLGVPLYQLPTIVYKARQNIRECILQLLPFPKIPEVLNQLHQQGYVLGIVSTNSKENIQLWLKENQLLDYFAFIHCSSHFFGKKRALKHALRVCQTHPAHACYIGDETRDIEAAKQAGVISVAVTWGFNAEKTLNQYHPHHMVHTPNELFNIFGHDRT